MYSGLCLFVKNLPGNTRGSIEYDPAACAELYQEIAQASGAQIEQIEVHIENTKYLDLDPTGILLCTPQGVHVDVELLAGLSQKAKDKIAAAIHHFLGLHGLGRDSDIAFVEFLPGNFYFEGQRVS